MLDQDRLQTLIRGWHLLVIDRQDQRVPLLPQSSIFVLRFLPRIVDQRVMIRHDAVVGLVMIFHHNVTRNLLHFHPQIVHVNNTVVALAVILLGDLGSWFFGRIVILFTLILHIDVCLATLWTLCLQIWLRRLFAPMQWSNSTTQISIPFLLGQKVLNLTHTNILRVHVDAFPQQYFLPLLPNFDQVLISLTTF